MTQRDIAWIDLAAEDTRWEDVGLEDLATRAATQTLRHLGLEPAGFSISILACDDERIAGLNSEFREKPGPTNVLSWPSRERGANRPGTRPRIPDPDDPIDAELGDIAISYDTVAREAADAQTSLENHTIHLIAHATLHLLGFDHILEQDGALMEGLEIEILAELEVANPYESSIVE